MPIYKNFNIKNLNKSLDEGIVSLREIENLEYYENYIFSSDFIDSDIRVFEHVWSHGDKLYKLADRYFGTRKMFWLIGLLNNKPTDAHYSYGDIVYIPKDWLSFYRSVVE